MKNKKYSIFKAYNYLKILYNRSTMQRNLVRIHDYHLGVESFDFTKTKEILLNEILEYSQKHCPYYKKLYKKINIEVPSINCLDRIPFLDKKIIKQNYTSLKSREVKRVTNYIMNTGGTTGAPLTFPVSSHYEYEHHEFAFKLFNYERGDEIVSFSGNEVCEDKIKKQIFWWKASKTNLPYGKIRLSSLYLNNETALLYISELNNIKPAFIRGYPSAINYLALYMLENDIQFNFELKGVFLTAEAIFTSQISSIKKVFKCPVSLEYGHSEVSVFAYTIDDTYEYYCSPFYGYTEVIGADGKHVSIGEVGEIVVTGFYNKAMPFIRYKTDDLALYNGNKDGLTRLIRIDGRTQDYLLNENGDKVFVVGLIYGGHHSFLDNIKKWQIIQNEPGFIEIKIIKGKYFSSKDESSIAGLFIKKEGIRANIEFVNEIGLTSRGKNKLVIQNTII
jgi:phenylacetate-CoA ligase